MVYILKTSNGRWTRITKERFETLQREIDKKPDNYKDIKLLVVKDEKQIEWNKLLE
jgi:hypothetical protein